MTRAEGSPGRLDDRAAVTVRPIRREDVPRVWELMRELAIYERLQDIFTVVPHDVARQIFEDRWPKVEALVAEVDGTIMGYAIYFGCWSSFRGRPIVWLEDLYVTDAHRGAGLGKALMRELARIALERGCARLAWDVLDWNQPSIEFYERLGAVRGAGWHTYTLAGEALAKLGG